MRKSEKVWLAVAAILAIVIVALVFVSAAKSIHAASERRAQEARERERKAMAAQISADRREAERIQARAHAEQAALAAELANDRPSVRAFLIAHPRTDSDFKRAMRDRKFMIGMTDEMVVIAVGRPERINRTVTSSKNHEQWIYGRTYIYFSDGVVTSFQDSK